MILTISGKSKPSALAIAACSPNGDIYLNRGRRGDINWGRYKANTTLNPDISNTTNKRVMRELFRDNLVPMPRLINIDDLAANFPVPCIGRPDRHTKGRGLWVCNSWQDVQRAMRGTRRKRAATHFMEYIDRERAPREYRVHIFKGKSIRISEKHFLEDGTKDYTTTKPQHRVWHVRKAAKQAVEAVGLDFGAVDILANDRECWVLEVNAAPGLGGSMPKLYADVFEQYMRGDWDG